MPKLASAFHVTSDMPLWNSVEKLCLKESRVLHYRLIDSVWDTSGWWNISRSGGGWKRIRKNTLWCTVTPRPVRFCPLHFLLCVVESNYIWGERFGEC